MKYKIMWYYGFYNYRYIIVFKKWFGKYRLLNYTQPYNKYNNSFINDFHELDLYKTYEFCGFIDFLTSSLPCDFNYAIKNNNVKEIYVNNIKDIINEIPEEFL